MSSLIPTSLSTAITSNWDKISANNFGNFFTNVFLVQDGEKGWTCLNESQCRDREKIHCIEELARSLVKGGIEIATLPNIKKFIGCINERWTFEVFRPIMAKEQERAKSPVEESKTPIEEDSTLAQSSPKKTQSDSIQFGVASVKFCWLSTFYPSLIYDNEDEKQPAIFYSLENFFHSKRIKDVDPVKSHAAKISIDPFEARTLTIMESPKKPKRRAKELNRYINILLNGILLKFSQNRVLADMLLRTRRYQLVNEDDGSIWNLKSNGKKEDILGTVLMSYREELRECNPQIKYLP